MINGQLKLSFGAGGDCHFVGRRQRRMSRAQWWFERMREVVDRAFDWQPAAAPRPEQIWFANAHREAGASSQQPGVAAKDNATNRERQICE